MILRFKKLMSVVLTGALLSSMTTTALAAKDALGEHLTEREVVLHEDTDLATNVFWSQAYTDLRTENYITYSPNDDVLPVVTYGDVLTERSTLSSMARKLEAQGYRVVAGINGDYYNTSTGLPVGVVITEGVLRSSDGGYYALGFKEDGSAIIGKPQVQINADMGYAMYNEWGTATQVLRRITGVNKARVSDGGIYLYTYDFNDRHTTGNTEAGVDVLCTILEGDIAIGENVVLQVEQVIEATSATVMGENQVVLSTNLKSGNYFVAGLRNAPVGAVINIQFTAADEEWNDVEYAVGALYQLAEKGKVLEDLPTGVNPRTAVGIKKNGDLIFYTIDGRRAGHSVGASLTQVAERLIELGCRDVVAMDGGGSTTLAITEPSAVKANFINKPSDGSERKVTNQIFLVADNVPSGRLSHFYVEPDQDFVLGGTRVQVAVSGVDTNYVPMDADYQLSAGSGKMEGDVLITPERNSKVTVTAKGGGRKGSAAVQVVKTPEEITVLQNGSAVTKLDLGIDTSVQLSVSLKYDYRPLYFDQELVEWELDGDIGTITADGLFTATRPGEGEIRITVGGKKVEIPVKVSRVYLEPVEDFESQTTIFDGYSEDAMGDNAKFTQLRLPSSDLARIGYGVGKLEYTLTEDRFYQAEWRAAKNTEVDNDVYTNLSMWVKGDGSGNQLYLVYSNGTKGYLTRVITKLDFTGWKQVMVPTVGEFFYIQGLRVSAPSTIVADDGQTTIREYADTARQGVVYIDQIMASYNDITDNDVPVITTEVDTENALLTAVVEDAEDGLLSRENIAVKATMGGVKGAAVPFAYDEITGELTVDLPRDLSVTGTVRITVTAWDASGNIGRASVDLVAENTAYAFTDIGDYWGADYVNFLYTSGVTTGYEDGTFRPNQNITRAQFSVMLYRYLGIAEDSYADVELPFADAANIPEYAVPAIRALYAMGVLVVAPGQDGLQVLKPYENVTRAEVATMIGRTQEKGYALVDTAFIDAANVPAYADYYIQTMAAQGIINGYEDGRFLPNNLITRGQMAKIMYNLM